MAANPEPITPNPDDLINDAGRALRAAAHAYDACCRKHGKEDDRSKQAQKTLENRAIAFAAAQLINLTTTGRR